MLSSREILKLGYPYNIFYLLGIEKPTDDQKNGLNCAISTLDEKTKKIIILRFKENYTYRDLGKYFNLSYQAFEGKIDKILKDLGNDKRVILGLEKYQKEFLKEEKNYNSFDKIYYRVMHKIECNKNNILMIQNYLFDKSKIIEEFNYLSICSIPFNLRIRNVNFITFYHLSVYEYLNLIYENPLDWFYNTRSKTGLGKASIIELISTLYNTGYLSEEQLLYIYLYSNIYNVKGIDNLNEFENLKKYSSKYKRVIDIHFEYIDIEIGDLNLNSLNLYSCHSLKNYICRKLGYNDYGFNTITLCELLEYISVNSYDWAIKCKGRKENLKEYFEEGNKLLVELNSLGYITNNEREKLLKNLLIGYKRSVCYDG